MGRRVSQKKKKRENRGRSCDGWELPENAGTSG